MAVMSPTRQVVAVVTFVGGPCEGTYEVGGGKTDHHIAAALAYEKYRAHTPGIGHRFWGGICAGDPHAKNYRIVEAKDSDGKTELVCKYEG